MIVPRSRVLARSPRRAMLSALLIATLLVESFAQSRPNPKPSLDTLFQRVNSYWSLLAQRKKGQALNFVASQSRDNFLARQDPSFSQPRVTASLSSKKPDEVVVTVTVKRALPAIGILDWPVSEKWVFVSGNWYALVADSSIPAYSTAEPKQPAGSGDPRVIEQVRRKYERRFSSRHRRSILEPWKRQRGSFRAEIQS